MAINIVDVEEVLRQQPHPLMLMSLEALNPAREPYRAILLQPSGMVEANDVRVGHAIDLTRHAYRDQPGYSDMALEFQIVGNHQVRLCSRASAGH
ncbi:hypothetical protein CUN61_05005 [Pseudomonas arsenicoxydans]|uniref:Uncharacterized protein n=1 Tax=Pseudomonas arsenicoxydans TaxID=702115 RepID=A0A4P6FWR7_9PSED|nr:hypothetical protein CUN61_05005 [Pseudomonas arsenicoxydans]